MSEGSTWYADESSLLDRLHRTHVHWGQVPQIDGYDMLVEESRGGQGIVYRARQVSTGQTVAIKILFERAQASEPGRLRFERELAVVSGLRHPNIVATLDRGVASDGRLFYVMEWVVGEPVAGSQKAADLDGTLSLFAKICDAVQYANQRGVIHRDLKPSNILIDEMGEPKILDFGLAKLVVDRRHDGLPVSSLSHTGQFLGSLAWASPEQVECDPHRIDVRSDVYSLGVILYKLLTGRLPHPTSSNLRQMLNDITSSAPRPPRTLRREIPGDLETIVLRCLAKEPERRYQTAGELAADIRRFMAGEPIDAKRDNRAYLVRKFLARHKALTSLALLLFLSLVGVALTMTVLYRRAVDAERTASRNLERATTETEKAKEIRRFLEEMLASVDPTRDGREARVIDILDRAAAKVGSGFKERPKIEASLRMTIGLSYRSLGLLDKAAVHLEKALALRTAELGEDRRDTLISRIELGTLRIRQGALPEAAKLLETGLDAGRRVFGDRDVLVWYAMSNLAALRNAQGRVDEAAPILQRLLAAKERWLGETDPRTIRTIHNYAAVLSRAGKKEEAVLQFRRALELHKKVHGPKHVHTVRTMGNLGTLYMQLDQLGKAEPLLESWLEGSRRILGKEHPETIMAMHNMAALRQYQGHATEALGLAKEVLSLAAKVLPKAHIMLARYQYHVGSCLVDVGRYEDAERALEAAYRRQRRQLGGEHYHTAATVKSLIRLYEVWKKPEQAGEWRKRLGAR